MRTRLALTLLPMAMLAAFAVGCQTTPLQRCVIAEGTYSAALETATAGVKLGKIDSATAAKIEHGRQDAAAALDAMWATAANGTPGFTAALNQFDAATDAIIAAEVQNGMKPGAPAK